MLKFNTNLKPKETILFDDNKCAMRCSETDEDTNPYLSNYHVIADIDPVKIGIHCDAKLYHNISFPLSL